MLSGYAWFFLDKHIKLNLGKYKSILEVPVLMQILRKWNNKNIRDCCFRVAIIKLEISILP